MVVDLTVENEREVSTSRVHRLRARRTEFADGQSGVTQPCQAPKPKPLTVGVGATVLQRTDARETASLRGKDGARCTKNAAHEEEG